jgi:hypothetical protein
MRYFNKSKKSKAGLISSVFMSGLLLLLVGFMAMPQSQVQADNQPEITPTVSAVKQPSINVTAPPLNLTPTPTITATVTPTPTVTISPSPVVTGTPETTPTPGETPSADATPTPTATPTPEPSQEDKDKAAKEKAKQEALAKARGYILSRGEPDAAAIDNWLARFGSPQLQETQDGKTAGQIYLELGWKYGINPAYALAFFTKESSCGTAGGNLASHNFGNIRWSPGYPTLDGVWRAYPNWTAGMEAWFKLIKENYMGGYGSLTLADVLPTYAPETENDTTLYMNQVMQWVDSLMLGSPSPNINLNNSQYFEATGYRVGWDFLNYWQTHGNVKTIGWPISNQQYENGMIVQYFERAVLEYHPENKAPYQILLRNLGSDAGKAQQPQLIMGLIAPDDGAVYFSETGHWLSGQFTKAWKDMGGLAQFGYPIAEPEVQGTTLVQWFERARFELDLSKPDAQVMLGLVGNEAVARKEEEKKSS